MGIKWDSIHLGVSDLTNEIFLCKGKEVIDNGRAYLYSTDKSEDRSQEVLDVAIQHLLGCIARSDSPGKKIVLEHEMYRLALEDLREART